MCLELGDSVRWIGGSGAEESLFQEHVFAGVPGEPWLDSLVGSSAFGLFPGMGTMVGGMLVMRMTMDV